MECMVVILKLIQAMFRLEITTTTVTNLPNVFSLATKNSVLVLTLATRFLYDLDLNGKSEVKTNISSHLALLCLRNVPNHKKKKKQFTSKFYMYANLRLRHFQTIKCGGLNHTTCMSCVIYIIQTGN